MFYPAEQGQYPWRKAIAIGVTVLGLASRPALWHSRALGMSAHGELIWSRKWVSAFGLAGLTFAAGSRPARQVAACADLARPDQLLRLPAASAGHRGSYHHFYRPASTTFYLQVLIAAGLLSS